MDPTLIKASHHNMKIVLRNKRCIVSRSSPRKTCNKDETKGKEDWEGL